MVIQHNICYESVLHLYKTSTRRGNASIIYISILDFFHDTFPNPNRLSLKHQGLWRPQPLWEQTKARSQRPVIPSIFACRGARRLCPRHGHGNKLGRPAWGQRASQLPSIGMTRQSWGNLITWLVWLVGVYVPIRSQEPKWLTPSLCLTVDCRSQSPTNKVSTRTVWHCPLPWLIFKLTTPNFCPFWIWPSGCVFGLLVTSVTVVHSKSLQRWPAWDPNNFWCPRFNMQNYCPILQPGDHKFAYRLGVLQ